MEQRLNKPRVFLSHSKKDVAFIKRLYDDLLKCQIVPWLDEYEIRQGKPWLDSIFESGVPTCDAILAYLTENSISSPVVKKEIDAGVLRTLEDKNVAFLPYVNHQSIRSSLRSDIQTLQVLEWNDSNYSSLLPSVVAEIWRSYLERTVTSATKDERVKRLEAELELEKLKGQSADIFSSSENAEFEYIWNSFDKSILVTLTLSEGRSTKKTFNLTINLATVIAHISEAQYDVEYNEDRLVNWLNEHASSLIPDDEDYQTDGIEDFPELAGQLLMYGLIEDFSHPTTVTLPYANEMSRLEHHMILSKKFYRFRYWLAYHQKLPDSIVMEIVENL